MLAPPIAVLHLIKSELAQQLALDQAYNIVLRRCGTDEKLTLNILDRNDLLRVIDK